MMVKRLFDIAVAGVSLLLAVPVLGGAALLIRLVSPGPIFFRARRIGKDGLPFTMFKFRTMHVDHGTFKSAITTRDDPRIFGVGAFLRKTKVDELPQLINVIKGDMSIVGPRPEDPEIVEAFYTPEYLRTLEVRPGLVSPGGLFYYTHGEQMVASGNPHQDYAEVVLPAKMDLELVYLEKVSFFYDIRIIFRAAWIIMCIVLGRRTFPLPPEAERGSLLFEPYLG